MRIAVIDDEPSLVKLSGHTIEDYGRLNSLNITVDSYLSGEDFLKNYAPGKYSIVFMDVFMPVLSGIETVLKLRETDVNTAVIFLTTSETHMKDALSCHAFDYLVKPATRADFFKVMDECIQFLGQSAVEDSKYIEFKSKGVSVRLSSSQIYSAVSCGHSVIISTKENSYDAKETFASIAELLSECSSFLLINRGVLVNMDYIEDFGDGGCCNLSNGERYSIKIRGSKSIIQAYEDYRNSI